MATHSTLLPGKSHGQRSLVDYSPWDHKESDTTERLHFHFFFFLRGGGRCFPGGSEVKASAGNVGDLGSIPGSGRSQEKEMATYSSILAWRIPWREEPGGLQSMGSQRVGHD